MSTPPIGSSLRDLRCVVWLSPDLLARCLDICTQANRLPPANIHAIVNNTLQLLLSKEKSYDDEQAIHELHAYGVSARDLLGHSAYQEAKRANIKSAAAIRQERERCRLVMHNAGLLDDEELPVSDPLRDERERAFYQALYGAGPPPAPQESPNTQSQRPNKETQDG